MHTSCTCDAAICRLSSVHLCLLTMVFTRDVVVQSLSCCAMGSSCLQVDFEQLSSNLIAVWCTDIRETCAE